MIDWGRWLPGLGSDETEQPDDPVQRALGVLGQGASAVGSAVSSGLGAVSDAATGLYDRGAAAIAVAPSPMPTIGAPTPTPPPAELPSLLPELPQPAPPDVRLPPTPAPDQVSRYVPSYTPQAAQVTAEQAPTPPDVRFAPAAPAPDQQPAARPYWQPTEQEQAGMGPPVGPEWLPPAIRQAAGIADSAVSAARAAEPLSSPWIPDVAEQAVGSALAASEPVQAAQDYARARIDPRTWAFAHDGIARQELSPEEFGRYNQLQGQMNPETGERLTNLSADQAAEFKATSDKIEAIYQRIKNDPDKLTAYANASPGYGVTSALTDIALTPAIGGGAASLASRGARAAGASQRVAEGVGYAADLAAQTALDPTTPFTQGPIDAATAALRAGVGAAGRGIGAAGQRVGEALDANAARVAAADARAVEQGSISLNAGLGVVPESGATDRLAGVNRALSQGIASSVTGGVGAQVNQELNPDDPYAGIKGFVGGALVPPLAVRGAGALARRAGAGAADARGALGVFGYVPAGGTGTTRAAQSPNPMIRNMARQMQGGYQPSGVDRRPLAERVVAALFDRNALAGNVEREITERVRAAGGPDPATRLAERVRVNPNSIAAQRATEEIAPALQAVGEDADWLEQYLVHRHNLDVAQGKGQEAYAEAIARGRTPQQAQAVADRVRQSRLFSGGMTEGDITQALADIPAEIGPARFKRVVDAAQAFWDTGRKSLDEKLAAGMISPQLHQELTTRYPHYVRTDIADYFEGGPAMPSPGGKTMGVSNVGIKAIDRVGTTKDRVNPVLSTIDALYAHEAAMTRNAAAQDLVTLRDADPTARQLFKEVAPDVKTARANAAEMVPPDYTLRGAEQKLTAWENGEARQFVVPGEYAQLLTPKQGALLGDSAIASGTRSFFGLWKSLITTHNPAFQMIVSPLRDLGDYAVGEATRAATRGGAAGAAEAAGALPGVVADYLKALPAAFEGLGQGRVGQEVAALRRSGAGFEGRPARTDRDLRATYRDLQASGGMAIRSPEDARRAARTALTLGAEPIGSRLEMVPRIAAARRAAGRGADELGQAMAYKDATIDFLRGGWLTQQLNVVVPFLNPTMQSAAQVGRLAQANPTAFAAAVGSGIGVPAMLADAWNRSDPDRAQAYEDVPESVKNSGIVWMLPDQVAGQQVAGSTALGERKPNYLWIPLGSFAFAAKLAREGLSLADPITGLSPRQPRPGREVHAPVDAAMRAAELGAEILGMFSPVKGENLSSSVASLVPPVAAEAIEVGIDKDLYRGNQIATDRRDERASRLSQAVASGLNVVGNTDQVRPSQVEHVIRGVGGYAGQLATAASDLGRDRGETRPIQDIPVAGGLASRVVRDTGGQQLEDARDPAARVPAEVRDVLGEAGMRSDEISAVSSRYHGAPLTHEEQLAWQQELNDELARVIPRVRRDPRWRDPSQQEAAVRDAVAAARAAAARRARLPNDAEIQRRIRDERERGGG